jgi:hypothetical protein
MSVPGSETQSATTSQCHQSSACVALPTLAVASQHGQQYSPLSSAYMSCPCLQPVVHCETPALVVQARLVATQPAQCAHQRRERARGVAAQRQRPRVKAQSGPQQSPQHGVRRKRCGVAWQHVRGRTWARRHPQQRHLQACHAAAIHTVGSAAPPGRSDSDSGGDDPSEGMHHGSDAGRRHHRANSLPEGLLPGGADIERGITYEGGLRHHTGAVVAAALQLVSAAQAQDSGSLQNVHTLVLSKLPRPMDRCGALSCADDA